MAFEALSIFVSLINALDVGTFRTMKATPGGSSLCSDGKNAGPFRLREL